MYAYLFGSVCPRKGISEAIIVPGLIKTSDRALKTNIGSHGGGTSRRRYYGWCRMAYRRNCQ
ncbi:hypothetical protein IFVP182_C2200002 [Vibrio parahaemolyticus]